MTKKIIPVTFYKRLSRLYPERLRNDYEEQLNYAGIKNHPQEFIGRVISYTFLFSILFGIYGHFKSGMGIIFFISSLIISQVAYYFYLFFKAEQRNEEIAQVFPAALKTIATNLRSGLQIDQAIQNAATKDLGILGEELERISIEIRFGGVDPVTSLRNFSKRVKNKTIQRKIKLMIYAIKNGSSLADLLDEASQTMINKKSLIAQINTSIKSYEMYIKMIMAVVIPLFSALSYTLIGIIQKQLTNIKSTSITKVGIKIASSNTVTLDFIAVMNILTIIITVILCSMTLGVITTGKEKSGLKQIPLYLLISILVYLFLKAQFTSLFGGLL